MIPCQNPDCGIMFEPKCPSGKYCSDNCRSVMSKKSVNISNMHKKKRDQERSFFFTGKLKSSQSKRR